jgi:hypothetical protein
MKIKCHIVLFSVSKFSLLRDGLFFKEFCSYIVLIQNPELNNKILILKTNKIIIKFFGGGIY